MYQGFKFLERAKADCYCRNLVDRMGNAILEIEFPENGKVRSRQVVTRSKSIATGKFPSWKMRRMIQWESINELNAYRLLDADPSVIAFHEQPLTIRFVLNGELCKHYPDVMVQRENSREIWEIKVAREASRPEVAARTRLLEEALPKLGFSYKMVLAEDLAQEPRLSNVLTLLKFGRTPISEFEAEKLRQALSLVKEVTWEAVLAGVFGKFGRNHICRLILEGKLCIDMERPLTTNSFISEGQNSTRRKWGM